MNTVNPRKFLKQLTGKEISVKLKWGMEYKGILVSSDRYFNLQMANTEEFVDGQSTGNLGEVLIRCNNVLYMRASEKLPSESREYYKDTTRDTFIQFKAEGELERVAQLLKRGYESANWVLKKYNVKIPQ